MLNLNDVADPAVQLIRLWLGLTGEGDNILPIIKKMQNERIANDILSNCIIDSENMLVRLRNEIFLKYFLENLEKSIEFLRGKDKDIKTGKQLGNDGTAYKLSSEAAANHYNKAPHVEFLLDILLRERNGNKFLFVLQMQDKVAGSLGKIEAFKNLDENNRKELAGYILANLYNLVESKAFHRYKNDNENDNLLGEFNYYIIDELEEVSKTDISAIGEEITGALDLFKKNHKDDSNIIIGEFKNKHAQKLALKIIEDLKNEKVKYQIAEDASQMAQDKSQMAQDKSQMAQDKSQMAQDKSQMAEDKSQIAEDKSQIAEDKSQMAEDKDDNVDMFSDIFGGNSFISGFDKEIESLNISADKPLNEESQHNQDKPNDKPNIKNGN